MISTFLLFTQYLATCSINILTIHDYLHYVLLFFSHSTFSLDLTNMWNRSNCSYRSVSHLCFWERLNNSGFCPITIPTDLISVFEIFLSPQGSIELPCLTLLPCQRKINARRKYAPPWLDRSSGTVFYYVSSISSRLRYRLRVDASVTLSGRSIDVLARKSLLDVLALYSSYACDVGSYREKGDVPLHSRRSQYVVYIQGFDHHRRRIESLYPSPIILLLTELKLYPLVQHQQTKISTPWKVGVRPLWCAELACAIRLSMVVLAVEWQA